MSPLKITTNVRLELIALVKSFIDAEKISLVAGGDLMRKELSEMTYTKSPHSNRLRIDHPKNGTDDTIMALGLALKRLIDFGFRPFDTEYVETVKKELERSTERANEMLKKEKF